MCKVQWDTMQCIVPQPRQVNNLLATIPNITISLTEQILEQLKITCSKREEDYNKVGSIVGVDIIEYM